MNKKSLILIHLLTLTSCASFTSRIEDFTDEIHQSLSSFEIDQEARRSEWTSEQEARQTDFELTIARLNSEADEKLISEEEFDRTVDLLAKELRMENKEALTLLKDKEIRSLEGLVIKGEEAIDIFKDGIKDDLKELKENGAEIALSAAKTAGSALGYGPIIDLLAALLGGSAVAGAGVNKFRDRKRKTLGADYIPDDPKRS